MRLSRIACIGLTALLISTSARGENPVSPRRLAQSAAGWGAEIAIRVGQVALLAKGAKATGEMAGARSLGLAGGVGIGLVVALAFGWYDAKHAPEAEKEAAYFDAFIRATGCPVTYRETYPAVRDGLVKAVINAPPGDPIHNSILGQMVRQAQAEQRAAKGQ